MVQVAIPIAKVVPAGAGDVEESDRFDEQMPREVLPEGDSEIQAQPWDAPRGKRTQQKKISGRRGLYRLTGTMAQSSQSIRDLKSPMAPAIRFVDACLRGYSQVFVINNPLCGLLILCGIFWDSWYTALASILAVVSSTGIAVLLGISWDAISAGLYGYNGVLTGIALVVFSSANQHTPEEQPEILAAVILMSAISSILCPRRMPQRRSPRRKNHLRCRRKSL